MLYLAILNNAKFDGFYSRLFEYPGSEVAGGDPSWYYLNRIDLFGCLEKVFKFDEIFNREQQDEFLVRNFNDILIIQCAWCKKFKRSTPDGETWGEFDPDRDDYHTVIRISHGICPSCLEVLN